LGAGKARRHPLSSYYIRNQGIEKMQASNFFLQKKPRQHFHGEDENISPLKLLL
jgi:hypothetical protein